MPQIEIDDEVFARLKGEAEPFVDTPNDVLRRLLGMEAEPRVAVDSSKSPALPRPVKRYRRRKAGELMPLLDAGILRVDDELVYQKRSGEQYNGLVTNDGWISVDGESFFSPSGALKSAVGYDVNGWKHWRVVRTDRLLDEYRQAG
ncbi:hypothetical protein VZC37_15715 [Gordonia sp. LSe1-13]|uniref:RAMA domain-containing protein n=1 Tax=Gordonia sesuvii TaxID=3116777 RepID=A0ABU7MFA2_9ACTN|nr:hypothetical protein [Gordonia sp. LSe1-13]